MKTYYVGQVPVESIQLTVVDETRNPRSLVAYTSAALLLTRPDGTQIAGGAAEITDTANGSITYAFPESTLFDQTGTYRLQLKLMNGTREDYTDILSVRVVQPLEETV